MQKQKVNVVRIALTTVIVAVVFSIGFALGKYYPTDSPHNIVPLLSRRVLDKYAIPNLMQGSVETGSLTLGTVEENETEKRAVFEFEFLPEITGETKVSTGEVRLPIAKGKYPLVVMFRGYVDTSIYETGVGTRNASLFLAQNGFVTIAPDFLGYGGSDGNAADIFESRFQTYTLAISLLKTVKNGQMPNEIIEAWDGQNIFIWAHSNGGQIALTALEAIGFEVPTALWAPVSKPFPYSVLYYTDESQDGGKYIRGELANFEERYNTDRYSLTTYLDQINAPVLIQQGTNDAAIPTIWSETLVNTLKGLEKDVEILYYQGADHNMRPLWDEAIVDTLNFYKANTISNP